MVVPVASFAATSASAAALRCRGLRSLAPVLRRRACWPPLPSASCCRFLCAPASPSSSSTASVTADLPARIAAATSLATQTDLKIIKQSLPKEDFEFLETLEAAVVALGDEGLDSSHPLVDARDKVLNAYRDKAALLKRDWTDEMFQDGEGENEDRVAEIETMLANCFSSKGTGLNDGTNLGSALDIVGVYMKNYKLDKADAVLKRCGPYVSQRGGVWMIKWLNHVSTVRMKQARHTEALEMLYDLELYSPFSAEEAPEFFETLYRNLAWALKAMGKIDDALYYFERMAHASNTHKGGLDWFDFWDIGKLAATRGYRDSEMPSFYRGRAMVEKALQMQIEAEPEDLVMRAKVHDSLAECFMIVKEHGPAAKHYDAAYDLMLQTVGRNSPLFGKQAKHTANLLIDQERHFDALPFLGETLHVEATRDAVNVNDALDIVDLIVNTQQKCGTESEVPLEHSNHASLKALVRNLSERNLADGKQYGVLCHKMSLLHLHECRTDEKAFKRARKMAKESIRVLRRNADTPDAKSWLQMSEMHLRMMSSATRP